jgi:hypothetical protein
MEMSRSDMALFPAYKATSECEYIEKPKNFKEKMNEIMKKEGIKVELPQKRETRSQSKKKEEMKKEVEEEDESQGEEE